MKRNYEENVTVTTVSFRLAPNEQFKVCFKSRTLTFSRFSHRSLKFLLSVWFVRLILLNLDTLTAVNIWIRNTQLRKIRQMERKKLMKHFFRILQKTISANYCLWIYKKRWLIKILYALSTCFIVILPPT